VEVDPGLTISLRLSLLERRSIDGMGCLLRSPVGGTAVERTRYDDSILRMGRVSLDRVDPTARCAQTRYYRVRTHSRRPDVAVATNFVFLMASGATAVYSKRTTFFIFRLRIQTSYVKYKIN
jgi:hypothetical protein